jgi:hypothetical protein
MAQTNSELLSKPECSEVVQTNLKPLPKLKSDSEALLQSADRVSGFRSDAERDAFYQALLELGKTKGVRSPAAWSTKIVKSMMLENRATT